MKVIDQFKNKKVLVLGLAKSGESAARLLDKLGAIVTVNDGKPFEDNPAAQSLLEEGIKVITGGHPLELLDEEFALMVKNPGIPYSNPMIEKALAKGIPVLTEVELAYLISEAPIIGITGSNGKTTTTTMIGEVLTAAGQHGLLSGNIGYPASQVAQTASDKDTLVMELSSFQLMGVQEFHPEIAVITNLMPTHIDYHGSFEEYVAAKWNIQNKMTAADFLVLNFNQDLAKELATKTEATVVPFSTQEKVDGAYLEDGQLYFRGEVVMAASEIGVPGSTMWKIPLRRLLLLNFVVWTIKPSRKLFQPLVVSNTVSNLWMKSRVSNSIMIANQPISWLLKKPCQDLTTARSF